MGYNNNDAVSQPVFDAYKADNATERNKTRIKYYNAQTITPKAYMTIVDDDARVEVLTKLKPIAIAKGIPITLAVPITYPYATTSERPLTPAELLDLQTTLSFEMASHTYTHPDLRTATDEEVLYELEESKKELESWGLNVDSIVYPFGSNEGGVNSTFIKELSSKFYNCGATVGGGTVNPRPVKSFSLNRTALGSFFETADHTDVYYKAQVDKAIAQNGWVIFMTHCHHVDHDVTQNTYLNNTIDYALANGVEIVNLRDGYAKMGNVIEVEGKLGIGKDGVVREVNNIKSVLTTSGTITGGSLITEFEKGTITRKKFDNDTKGTLPEAGYLETFRPFTSDDYGYQHIYGYYDNVYYRRWLNVTGWKAWEQITKHKLYSVAVDCGTLTAGAVKNITLAASLPTIGLKDVVIIQPNSAAVLPGEVMVSNGGTRLFLFNTHTADFVVGTKTFNVVIITQGLI